MNIGSSLSRNARILPDKVAVIFNGKFYSYDQLNRIVNRLAHGLISLGIKKGEKICLMMKNSEYFLISQFAAYKIGAVVIPINIRLTKSEVAYIVDDADAKVIIFDAEFGDLIEKARSPKVIHCIANNYTDWKGHLSFDQVMSEDEKDPDIVVNQTDDAHIMYTSGTTGKPKGALYDHFRAIMFVFNSLGLRGESTENRILLFMPLFFGAGFSQIYKCIFLGNTAVIHQKFNPVEVLKDIEKYQIDTFLAVPTMFNMILQVPNNELYDLSSIKNLQYGGAPMPPELIKKTMKLFNTDQLINRYGLTEGGPGGIYLYPEDHKNKLGTSGKARFLIEARVVDDKGMDVHPGDSGELILRGEMIMKGYYKNAVATRETIHDGWLFTGDIATIDEDKYIKIVDRKKDMIISGGINVYSVEVEDVLYSYEGILDAAVIGVPNEIWGETVTAIIVPKPGYSIDNDRLIEFCREHLADYKIPRNLHYIYELPRNASGKVLKYDLRNQYLNHQSGRSQHT